MAAECDRLFRDAIRNLLITGEYSDFTIVCEGREWKVHKAIICPRSEYFSRAVNFGVEAETKTISLVDDSAEVVSLMLEYFYTGHYSPPLTDSSGIVFPHMCIDPRSPHSYPTTTSEICDPRSPHSYPTTTRVICTHHTCGYNALIRTPWSCSYCAPPRTVVPANLVHHAELYALADKYQITGLKQLVQTKFKNACQWFWNTAQFPTAVDIVYATTPEGDRGLRQIVVETIAAHMEIVKKPEMEHLMIEYNGLAFELLKMKAGSYGWR